MLEMQSFDGKMVLSAYRFADPGYWLADTQGANRSLLKTTIIEQLSTIMAISNANSICGIYGMCSSPDNETETCNCLPGHTPLDPDNVFKGCRPKTVMNYCAENSRDNFTVELIEDADFVSDTLGDLSHVDNVDMEECKKAIIDDCNSLAASWANSTCRKKRTPLVNAKKSVSTKGIKALIKVPIKVPITNKKKFNSRAFLEIGSIITAILAFLFGVAAIYYNPAAQRFIKRNEEDDLFLPGWVVSCVISGNLETVVSHDPEVLSDFERFERMAMVGLWCINPDPILRPSMNKVVQMLEGTLEVGIPPLIHDQM
ncbi:hypothetical protein EZV62_000612 [Acer yangbiense]|uniref:S-locus glycoprotein domain-containing protein n=1 Tax=Acer yangbiense TaxID=1000413 RepID=A0A5C7IRM4_9ROSI|nr:hypothetical protein EZV62_000612 [Acer yangbiense]